MAQNYTVNYWDSTSSEGMVTLQIMENNFECLRSMFSGSAAPSEIIVGMPWFSTTSNGLKLRNAADDAWLGVFLAELTTKVWMYANIAEDGWVIDSSVSDRLLALKGGALGYDEDGGTESSTTWTQPSHTLIEAELASHQHDSVGDHTHPGLAFVGGSYQYGGFISYTQSNTKNTTGNGAHTHGSIGNDDSHNHGNIWRPYAAVGTRQYMAGLS